LAAYLVIVKTKLASFWIRCFCQSSQICKERS